MLKEEAAVMGLPVEFEEVKKDYFEKKLRYELLRKKASEQVQAIKDAFAKNSHTRFMKHFEQLPFGRKTAYTEKVQKASLEKIAQLIKVCSFLLQMKVYLFWEKPT